MKRSGSPTRVFHTQSGRTVAISNLLVSGGRTAGFSGGLLAQGPSSTTTLIGMLFTGNIAIDTSGSLGGGGAASINGGALNILNSTFSRNTGTNGGGLFVAGAGPLNLVNVTITNNLADGNNGSGSCSVDGDGGGIAGPTIPGTPINLRNTIVAGNLDCNSNLPNISPNGFFNNQGNNLTSGDPLLGPLQNNGGPTFTHALLYNSTAVDAGNACVVSDTCTPAYGVALATDQRGAAFPRQVDGDLVYRTYQAAFGDLPGAPVPLNFSEFRTDSDLVGDGVIVNATGWQAKLEANKLAYLQAFVARTRFTSAYPNTLTPAEFVDRLFMNAEVAADSRARTTAIAEFGGAATSADSAARARALRRVAENEVLGAQEFKRAFVLLQYYGYLGRDPNAAPDGNFSGFDFWLHKLEQFNGDFRRAEMVKAFLVAGEYRARFSR